MSTEEKPEVVIQEGTAWGLSFSLTDKDGIPEAPTNISFEIHDEASATSVDSGSVAPASTFEITLSTTANTLVDKKKTSETRVLTLTNTYSGAEDKQIIVYRWIVKRSKFLS